MPFKIGMVIDNPKNNRMNNFGDKNLNNISLNANVNNINKGYKNVTMNLQGSMIGRVYKAKAGCSSCGK